jgi:chlorobactene glucosyltransferase
MSGCRRLASPRCALASWTWIGYQVGLVGFLTVVLLIVLSNLRALRRLGCHPLPSRLPCLSVLLPVRDEVENVEPCVRSLLAQKYADFEVLVLDDGSTDGTGLALAVLEGEDDRVRVLQGEPLPDGWLGKHWACHQLAQAARGELLLFTDADTRHHPHTLREAVAALIAERADMLTAFPKEEVHSWAERLIVPIFQWAFFSFLPVALAHRLSTPGLSAAIGQFMLFRRPAYDAIGGYAAVRQEVAEDMGLARRIVAHHFRWRIVDGTGRIRCRMYKGRAQVIEGFSKNLFAVFGYRLLPFLFAWLWTWAAFWVPWGVWLAFIAGARVSPLALTLAAVSVVESFSSWAIFYWRFRLPLYLACLYPLTTLLFVAVAVRSLLLALTGRATWKGRPLAKQRVRWL